MQHNEYEIPEEKLKEWEGAESKSTPGPWRAELAEDHNYLIVPGLINTPTQIGLNNQFIVIARTALPLLLAAYRKQREEIKKLLLEVKNV